MVVVDKKFINNLIKIGKNAKENDTIITEAKETDIWLAGNKEAEEKYIN